MLHYIYPRNFINITLYKVGDSSIYNLPSFSPINAGNYSEMNFLISVIEFAMLKYIYPRSFINIALYKVGDSSVYIYR